ncbi:MAG: hypothetical protein KAG91_02965 [Mycoplasmataceae bacterium]|nr:hypothetical protein [Mycoplasmataceae bacterium]
MAKIKVSINIKGANTNTERNVGVFVNDVLVKTNTKLTAKQMKAQKAEAAATGTKSSGLKFGSWDDIKLKPENILELRKQGLKGFTPSKKPITFSATDDSKVIVKVSRRGLILGLILGKYKTAVKVK